MGYYDGEVKDAEEQIREAGELVQFVRLTTTEPDPDAPWNGGEVTEESQDLYCVFLNFGNSIQYFQGTSVPRGAKKILMPCLNLQGEVPLQSQIRRANGEVWKVEAYKLLDPNGQRILYTIMGVQ